MFSAVEQSQGVVKDHLHCLCDNGWTDVVMDGANETRVNGCFSASVGRGQCHVTLPGTHLSAGHWPRVARKNIQEFDRGRLAALSRDMTSCTYEHSQHTKR